MCIKGLTRYILSSFTRRTALSPKCHTVSNIYQTRRDARGWDHIHPALSKTLCHLTLYRWTLWKIIFLALPGTQFVYEQFQLLEFLYFENLVRTGSDCQQFAATYCIPHSNGNRRHPRDVLDSVRVYT